MATHLETVALAFERRLYYTMKKLALELAMIPTSSVSSQPLTLSSVIDGRKPDDVIADVDAYMMRTFGVFQNDGSVLKSALIMDQYAALVMELRARQCM